MCTGPGRDLPSSLGPVFTFRLPVMADTDTVTLGRAGWASVSMTTIIWVVRRATLWKWARAPGPPALSGRTGVMGALPGEEWGVVEAEGGAEPLQSWWCEIGRASCRERV